MRHYLLACLFIFIAFCSYGKTVRVLAIGNSFSQDAIEQNLFELSSAYGDTMIIGNAYIPGCQIDVHYNNILSGKPAYSYRKVVAGKKTTTDTCSLFTIIADEPWDVISLQQASHVSGNSSTYANLPALKREVIKLMPNKDAEIIWHMTWAYAKDADHFGFKYYNNDQQTMNDSIYSVVCAQLPPNNISKVVPAGLAIQLAREAFGDILNSDGYHLSGLGRYVAACTWCEFLTGHSVVGNPYHPETISSDEALKAQQAAHNAILQFTLNKN